MIKTIWQSKKHKDSSLWFSLSISEEWFFTRFSRVNGWCLIINLFKIRFQLTYNNKKFSGELGRLWAKELETHANCLLKDISKDLFKKFKKR